MEAVKEAFVRALKAVTPSSKQANKPFELENKAKDILAFRTIITMLSLIQSRAKQDAAAPGTVNEQQELKVLDALAAVLLREHEITAVVAKPHNGPTVEVFVSVVHPNYAKPFPTQRLDKGLLEWVLEYFVIFNPRNQMVHDQSDSLINRTTLPCIVNPNDNLPKILVGKENEGLLNTFLQCQW